MQIVTGIEFMSGSNEERLPDFDPDFPCIASCATLDNLSHPQIPWHWHKAIELFFIQSGALTYSTPGGNVTLHAGCAGLVNANILHATCIPAGFSASTQYLYLFDPSFLSGMPGSRIDQKYIRPITTHSGLELIPLFCDNPGHAPILRDIRIAFEIHPDTPGYELLLREKLCSIWLQLFSLVRADLHAYTQNDLSGRVKLMMSYIHEHYSESIPIKTLAQAAICSERECYRAFHACLHMTPTAYLQSYRLQMACRMLASGSESLTVIAHDCGFGSSSYLGKVFRSTFGMTPMQYRQTRQNN